MPCRMARGLPLGYDICSMLARIVTGSNARRRFTAVFAMIALVACSKEPASEQRAAARTPSVDKKGDSAAGTVDLGPTTYRPVELTAVGSVAGTVTLDGPPTADSVSITADQQACGTKAEGPVTTSGKGLSNTIIWVADAASGKALPIERRIAIASDQCALDPRVQAAIAGTTVNVENDDMAIHRFVFTHLGRHDTLTVIPFFNAGEVVASERIAKTAGLVEVHCAVHPWMRAYIAVFDHPYFAVTEKSGAFTIDSLPPGNYRMMVWHEGTPKPVERQLHIVAGAASRMDLALKINK
ncbi:MAG TPA: carboxypeptidase regulatory-like domain-containing protein [Gemmatimonadaceae bacterium]|nr:carboxypeptidase regulatory-like domain-containing protein [Gemmatimonadaceae bacterium]